VCCSVLQCIAVCCSLSFDLQRNEYAALPSSVCCSVFQCVAVCCSVLHYVVVCCSTLPYVAGCCIMLQCVAVCCIMLQCVTVCYRLSLCVAWCYSAFQCVAVYFSVLQSLTQLKWVECAALRCGEWVLVPISEGTWHVSFAKEPYKRDHILHKRPITFRMYTWHESYALEITRELVRAFLTHAIKWHHISFDMSYHLMACV